MPRIRPALQRPRLVVPLLLLAVLATAAPASASGATLPAPRLRLGTGRELYPPGVGAASPAERTVRCLELIHHQPLLLHALSQQMPERGDLHNHRPARCTRRAWSGTGPTTACASRG